LFSPTAIYSYRFSACTAAGLKAVKDYAGDIDNKIRLVRKTSYFGCFLPFPLCDSWITKQGKPYYFIPKAGPHDWEVMRQKRCPYSHLVAFVFSAVTRQAPQAMTAIQGRIAAVIDEQDKRAPNILWKYLEK